MARPTLRMSFVQMQTRVAEYLGIADTSGGAAAPPADPHDLDVVKRLVNDGYRQCLNAREWNFLRRVLTVKFYSQKTYTLTAGSATTATAGGIAGQFADDFFNGYEFTIVRGFDSEAAVVTDFVGSTGVFTFASMAILPTVADTLQIAGPRNVAGQAWRIYMPEDFYGSLILPFVYDENGPRTNIDEVNEIEIREARATNRSSGTVSIAAFRPVTPLAPAITTGYEAIFWPTPTDDLNITGIYRAYPNQLVADSDYIAAPVQHDDTILHSAMAQAELYRDDQSGIHNAMYLRALQASIMLDKKSTPARNIPYGDKTDGLVGRRPSNYYQVDSYNGTGINNA